MIDWICAICRRLINPDEDYHSWTTPYPDDEIGWARFKNDPRWKDGTLFHAVCCPLCAEKPKTRRQAVLDACFKYAEDKAA